jgi:hypothetical protein
MNVDAQESKLFSANKRIGRVSTIIRNIPAGKNLEASRPAMLKLRNVWAHSANNDFNQEFFNVSQDFYSLKSFDLFILLLLLGVEWILKNPKSIQRRKLRT